QAGGGFQRQGPRQKRWIGRRTVQRQDVDESVRRNRRRGGPAPERGRQGNRGRGGIDRPRAGGGNHSDRARHGRRPRHSGQSGGQRRTAGGGKNSQGHRRRREARP